MTAFCVIGVGNHLRGDDAVGHWVVEELGRRHWRGPPGKSGVATKSDADPERLMSLWDRADHAVVVDGVVSDAPPGTVRCWDLAEALCIPATAAMSTHGVSVFDTLRLGKNLGRLPRRLTLIGIEIERCDYGAELTELVRTGAERAVALIFGLCQRGS